LWLGWECVCVRMLTKKSLLWPPPKIIILKTTFPVLLFDLLRFILNGSGWNPNAHTLQNTAYKQRMETKNITPDIKDGGVGGCGGYGGGA
jgi:hypothetical protein